MFLTVFPPFYAKRVSCSRRSEIFFKDWSDQYAIVALYKRATVSESIPSIFNVTVYIIYLVYKWYNII